MTEPRSFGEPPRVAMLTGENWTAALDAAMRAAESLAEAKRLGVGVEEAELVHQTAVDNLAALAVRL